MKKIILGINCSGFTSSACLTIDGKIKSAISEERITRIKKDKTFPLNAIKYCCDNGNISIEQITDIFIGWNPRFYLHKTDFILDNSLRQRGLISYLSLNELSTLIPLGKQKTNNPYIDEISQHIKALNIDWNIHYVDHHKAHISNAFLLSGFEKSDFFIADGFGESSSGCSGNVDKKNINEISNNRTPHSLGLFYSTFTDFLGFKHNSDEWKVMALSSLGNPKKYYDQIRSMIKINDLTYELDLSFFEVVMFWTNNYFSPKFVQTFGNPCDKIENLGKQEYDLVSALQKVVEEVVIEILCNLHKRTKNENLVVSGGFFMNSLLNGKIISDTPYKKLFIGGSPDDSGISIGSALYGSNYVIKNRVHYNKLNHNYFGKKYYNQEVENELKLRKIPFQKIDKPEEIGAKLIYDQKIIAWFQGCSEFGERALGNRSILADPTNPNIKDLINKSIKYREGFRPFAPAVLSEYVHDMFHIPSSETAFFMEKIFIFKEKWRQKLPGVVHFDGTGRLQTVDKIVNPIFYNLIYKFFELSSCPVVLNTSFNINKMPLVETPGDAIDCFFKSGIDSLIINNYLINKYN